MEPLAEYLARARARLLFILWRKVENPGQSELVGEREGWKGENKVPLLKYEKLLSLFLSVREGEKVFARNYCTHGK